MIKIWGGQHKIRWLAVIGVIGLFGLSLTIARAVRYVRGEAADSQCQANIFSLGTGLSTYRDLYGCMPPPFITDQFGKPLYSWRVLVIACSGLPIAEQFDYTKPWDDAANIGLTARDELDLKNLFSCPSIDHTSEGETDYFYVLSKEDRWPRDFVFDRNSRPKILLVESASRHVSWSEPVDFSYEKSGQDFLDKIRETKPPHPGGFNCITSGLLPFKVPSGKNQVSDLRILALFEGRAEADGNKEGTDRLIDKLTKALSDPRHAISKQRRPALLLLGELGPQAVSAVPAIREIMAGGDASIGKIAALALSKIEK